MDGIVAVPSPRQFVIGAGYAAYRGPTSGDGHLHRHAAFQVAIAADGEVAMMDSAGARHQAPALAVTPMTPHRILVADELTTFFVEPHCALADAWRRELGRGIIAAPRFRELQMEHVIAEAERPSRRLDSRLVEAMKSLQDESLALSDVAAVVGLSAQRLRALARNEIGMPLARWRVWSRLRRAAECIRTGQSLAEAAVSAGFADQAQFTRQMREMIGLTPAAVVPILRGQLLRAT